MTGTSVEESGAACAPATPLASVPPVPQDLALPPGSLVTQHGGRSDALLLTGRVAAPVEDVLAHFRTALERAGFVLQRDEDEGRAGELGFFGARADGTVVVSRLTCPRGETGFTLSVRDAVG